MENSGLCRELPDAQRKAVVVCSQRSSSVRGSVLGMGRCRISRVLARKQQRAEKKKSRSLKKIKKKDIPNCIGAQIDEALASVSPGNCEDDIDEMANNTDDIEMKQAPIVCQNKLRRQQLPLMAPKHKSKPQNSKKNGVVSLRVMSKKKARKLLKEQKRKARLIERQNAAMEVA